MSNLGTSDSTCPCYQTWGTVWPRSSTDIRRTGHAPLSEDYQVSISALTDGGNIYQAHSPPGYWKTVIWLSNQSRVPGVLRNNHRNWVCLPAHVLRRPEAKPLVKPSNCNTIELTLLYSVLITKQLYLTRGTIYGQTSFSPRFSNQFANWQESECKYTARSDCLPRQMQNFYSSLRCTYQSEGFMWLSLDVFSRVRAPGNVMLESCRLLSWWSWDGSWQQHLSLLYKIVTRGGKNI